MSNFCLQDVENKDKSFDVVKFGNNFSRPGQILILISIFSKCERTRNRVNVQSSITNSTFILYVIRSIKTRHSCRSQQAPGYHNEEMTSLTTEKDVIAQWNHTDWREHGLQYQGEEFTKDKKKTQHGSHTGTTTRYHIQQIQPNTKIAAIARNTWICKPAIFFSDVQMS